MSDQRPDAPSPDSTCPHCGSADVIETTWRQAWLDPGSNPVLAREHWENHCPSCGWEWLQ